MHDQPQPDDSLRTRLSLLERVKNLDDARSWDEFFHRYRDLVHIYARRRGLREHEVEEVGLEVFQRIARTIHDFHIADRPGAFRTWLGRLTGWRARDKLRERTRSPTGPPPPRENSGGPARLEHLPAPSDSDIEFEAEARRRLLDELFQRLEREREVTPRDLQVFQLLVVENMPVARVARLFSLSLTHTYVLKHRVMRKLRAAAQKVPLASVEQ